jgi:hypothetical protein
LPCKLPKQLINRGFAAQNAAKTTSATGCQGPLALDCFAVEALASMPSPFLHAKDSPKCAVFGMEGGTFMERKTFTFQQ